MKPGVWHWQTWWVGQVGDSRLHGARQAPKQVLWVAHPSLM